MWQCMVHGILDLFCWRVCIFEGISSPSIVFWARIVYMTFLCCLAHCLFRGICKEIGQLFYTIRLCRDFVRVMLEFSLLFSCLRISYPPGSSIFSLEESSLLKARLITWEGGVSIVSGRVSFS